MAVQQSGRLILDPDRREGCFARRETERARRTWFYEEGDGIQGLWDEYRRREAGARAEETVGRFLVLLDGWKGAKIFHAVEFRGSGLPRGDIDHLVLFDDLSFALVVESKYRLGGDVEEKLVPLVVQHAKAVSELTGRYVWPVLCQALPALRDDIHDESIGRTWSDAGTALLCDVEWLPLSIMQIVNDLDRFRVQDWTFPDASPTE
jgi:hypothetical protein